MNVNEPSKMQENTMRLFGPVIAALVLAACEPSGVPLTGMANPASVNCERIGGRIEIRDGASGQTGYCHLPDGNVVEEWELFRSNAK